MPGADDSARTAAATAAADLVEPGMTIGLGSGRAVWKLVELLGQRVGEGGDLAGLRAATASSRTDELARSLGIEVIELDGTVELDLALDGADEADPQLRLLKGGGGALLREKIVISAARRFVVVAETPKKVERLGEHFRLPVEVVRFAWRDTRRRLGAVLPDSLQRLRDDGEPYLTDEGHFILDCALPGDIDLDDLGPRLKQVPGVVEHGLFIGMAERALLGRPDGGIESIESV
ncbi:MAG TPA: ribose-5-phosphate isomerase RpiA [Thermoleophilaceae bacterium]|nr:ribose-5-phosphate isomerase RpiA [Actinomycetota bacterium]HYN53010.1 ribose-5-phosphate isomerase RpiA [Thermoleophilaceae bacterium]